MEYLGLNIALTPSYSKFLFHTVAVVLMVQAIYFYNAVVGWIHLPLFVLFMMVVDVYKYEYRQIKLELITLFSFSLLAIMTILLNENSYLELCLINALLLVICFQCMLIVYQTMCLLKHDNRLNFINDANVTLVNKKNNFMPIFLMVIQACLIGVVIMVVLRIIQT